MSIPPALLARLAQRGLVQKQKSKESKESSKTKQQEENEEVIAEDYDEMENDQNQPGPESFPSKYDHTTQRKRPLEENFWAERIRARLGESTSATGHKGCPNKYNIWHKCTLYCVNRWEDGHTEPSREYMKRYKRLLRKFPLPKGWTEIYDPGCGCFYFYSATENLVSWLPPTHPKSQVTKSAAVLRRQLEERETTVGGNGGSDGEEQSDEEYDERQQNASTRHQREVEDIISASMRPRSRSPSREHGAENIVPPRKQNRVASQRQRRERERERDYDRERERERDRGGSYGSRSRRHYGREGPDILDPMDPSGYSDTSPHHHE